jgi:hypothetical protein
MEKIIVDIFGNELNREKLSLSWGSFAELTDVNNVLKSYCERTKTKQPAPKVFQSLLEEEICSAVLSGNYLAST